MGKGQGRTVPRARLSAPRLPTGMVPRDRVLGLLTGQPPIGADITLVCAPAGYGKTTLLASAADWYRSGGRCVAWITCDALDDPGTFWATVLAALEHAVGPDGGAFAGLGSLQAPRSAGDRLFLSGLRAEPVAGARPGDCQVRPRLPPSASWGSRAPACRGPGA